VVIRNHWRFCTGAGLHQFHELKHRAIGEKSQRSRHKEIHRVRMKGIDTTVFYGIVPGCFYFLFYGRWPGDRCDTDLQ